MLSATALLSAYKVNYKSVWNSAGVMAYKYSIYYFETVLMMFWKHCFSVLLPHKVSCWNSADIMAYKFYSETVLMVL